MRNIFLLFLFICITGSGWAQLLYPEVMEPRTPLNGPVVNKLTGLSFPPFLYKVRQENRTIENPGVRYAIQNLKKERYPEPQVNEAINTLIRYAEDERLKHVVEYLKRYAQTMGKKEQALETLEQKITYDSIEFYKNTEYLLTGDFEEYINTDLQTFVNYIHQDSNYIWLRDASRDSVLLEIMSVADNSVRFWVNNGRMQYHRFWASNKICDTIGTWIQVMPQGNRLKIYVDEDVYQTPAIEKKHAETNEAGISNRFDDEYFKLNPMQVGQLHRRYWTYYSEVELAMSQGKLANWTSGGENSLSLLSNIRYFWNYNRNNTSWENWVHYRFGFMKNGDEDIRKNEDRFELNSKLGQRAFKHWYYTAQFNVITQLFNSYEYPQDQDKKLVANFMSPGDFTLSLGLDFKPNDRFSLFISPIAGKWNFVRDTAKIDVGRYGVEQGKRARREAGARIDLRSTQNNIFKIMNIRNELTWFMSYEKKDHYMNFESDNEEKKKIPFTVNWKLNIDFNINYFMRASIYTETIYNENNSKKLQFKENLNLGVNFRF